MASAFATIVGGGSDAEDIASRRVIPDPVRAIESALPAIFAEANDLPIEQFMTRLAAIFPVFETGSVRQDFEAMRLTPLAWPIALVFGALIAATDPVAVVALFRNESVNQNSYEIRRCAGLRSIQSCGQLTCVCTSSAENYY